MQRTDVIVVTGVCGPERRRLAHQLARAGARHLISASRVGIDQLDDLGATDRALIECDAATQITEIIGALTDPAATETLHLTGVMCVTDALHLLDDLAADDFVATEVDANGAMLDCTARALLTVTQIEFASVIVIVNWETVPTPDLARLMALISHLSPLARLRLDGSPGTAAIEPVTYRREQQRAGWVRTLNGDADPHMTDRRVSSVRTEQMRPLHPGRLQTFLDRVEAGRYGHVVRSAGFCRFATRPRHGLYWDHVGRTIEFREADPDADLDLDLPETTGDTDLPHPGQALACIGIDLDAAGLHQALDAVALSDDEFMAGPAAWAGYPDPFPRSAPAEHGSD
ncbi:hypothetical protein GCM10009847_19420 [Leucobacter tardus]|uniref:GTP-binding protein n=1 Tax=Leucobacter tardus TaxID=501483 RepID=A0A939QKT4_9MICO|nr:GTP-binding protein [Leucobacter tardus]MBO2990544.1 GTP-binding protein [Leucobacter tardus]